MIYTVTLNPSIDFIVRLDQLTLGSVNRMESDDKYAGGKGINVSRMLQRLGITSTATGFLGGFTGRFIQDYLEQEMIRTEFVAVDQDTRINVKIKASDETEINGQGPVISKHQLTALKDQLAAVETGDIVVFAGSAPASLGNGVYKELIELVRQEGAEIVCDFEGQTLLDTLAYQPLLVKPNKTELEAIFKITLQDLDAIEACARQLLEMGAKQALISMAGDGALLVTKEATYFAKPITGKVKNSVGAGDSMVAGFTGEFALHKDPIEALKWGVACGTATAFSDDLATIDDITKLYAKVEVEKR